MSLVEAPCKELELEDRIRALELGILTVRPSSSLLEVPPSNLWYQLSSSFLKLKPKKSKPLLIVEDDDIWS